jgi:hypothetical protein
MNAIALPVSERDIADTRHDTLFRWLLGATAVFVLVTLAGAALSMLWGGRSVLASEGLDFFFSADWNPVENKYGALVPIYGTVVTAIIAMLIAVPVSFGIAFFLTEVAPRWMRTPVGTAIELLAGIPSIIYGMWGFFVLMPVMREHLIPWLDEPRRHPARHRQAVPGAADRHRHADVRHRAFDHGDPVHLLGDARGVPDRAIAPEGIGLRAGRDQVGSELGHRPAVHALGGDRRRVPGPGPRAWRNDGGRLRDRQQRQLRRRLLEPAPPSRR